MNEGLCDSLKASDFLYIADANLPLARPATLRDMLEALQTSGASAIRPTCGGCAGSPLLLARETISALIDSGLPVKAAAASISASDFETEDEGVLISCPQAEFDRHARRTTGMSELECERLFEEFSLLENIRDHCERVAAVSELIALRCVEAGVALDLALIKSAALLHDLMKLEPKHADAAANLLASRGYEAAAEIVREHMNPERESRLALDEAAIVYLADKLIRNDDPVSVEERYAPALAFSRSDPPHFARVNRAIAKSNAIIELFERLTGEKLYELCNTLKLEPYTGQRYD
ncbi:MAG: HD domain-containing protein [Oscillospiraceae bacterium]|nr:HD domain-containing protein [Oscillospiraceae bacterium]